MKYLCKSRKGNIFNHYHFSLYIDLITSEFMCFVYVTFPDWSSPNQKELVKDIIIYLFYIMIIICLNIMFRLVKCNCTEGFYGDRCEYAQQDSSVKLLSRSNQKSFSLKASLSRR